MKYRFFLILLLAVLFSCSTPDAVKHQPPNILLILADDLGYGETGAYGQSIIETPNIDKLAQTGIRFSEHYSGAPVCAPARCILLTGKHAGHAHIRGNDEWASRGDVWSLQAMFENPNLEGQRPLPDSVVTIAEHLKTAGYRTAIVGKWGLGAPNTEGIPNNQGFDLFYGYNCQRQAHTLYPLHLWKNKERVLLNNRMVPLHANLEEEADPSDPASYNSFTQKDYAPELMLNEALTFLEGDTTKPFFLYFASPLPHLPLQAPNKWIEYYQEKIGDEEPYIGNAYYPNRTPRATYAAMISYLDEQVGSLIKKLKETGQYENTLIIFTSDNGPTYTGGVDAQYFESAAPFPTEYGRTKGFVYESGIRVPMIASWPGKIRPGTTSDHPSVFYDYLPTLLEVAGLPEVPSDGISFLPGLLGEEQIKHDFLYWEFPSYGGQQAVRMGKWKAIRKEIKKGNTTIELYNLEEDRSETSDVAHQFPLVVQQVTEIFEREHQQAAIPKFRMAALGDQVTQTDE